MEMLRRHLWVVDLAGIALGAVVFGQAAATLISSALPRLPAPRVAHAAPAPAPAHLPDKAFDGIVGRNIFCSTCGDAPAAAPPAQTTRALTLLAVMFAPPPADRRWSIAVIRNDAAATAGPYAVGARLGDATVGAIDEVRVTLDVDGGRREILELLRGPARGPQPAPAVDKIAGHRYRIPRAALDGFLGGGVSAQWPRVVPQLRDGKPIGFRLLGIRSDGPFAAIGLDNGDILLEVNGTSIETPDTALAAYAKLRTASHVWLAIERAGRRIRIDYDIR